MMLEFLPTLDSAEMAQQRQSELSIPRVQAARLGQSAVKASRQGFYRYQDREINWSPLVKRSINLKQSISPQDRLPDPVQRPPTTTKIRVSNETTLGAAFRTYDTGLNPIALNFASGINPGGGFLSGGRAQEEVLCRSSCLYSTLVDDPMYASHLKRTRPDSTDWAIYSPEVPIFRTDNGEALDTPWLLTIVSCAAPYAPAIGQPESSVLLEQRIIRVLSIAQAFGHKSLILGAWGCGAFGNDAQQTAISFRRALETEFNGVFAEVVFAIADWSPERKFLAPFRDVFSHNFQF